METLQLQIFILHKTLSNEVIATQIGPNTNNNGMFTLQIISSITLYGRGWLDKIAIGFVLIR